MNFLKLQNIILEKLKKDEDSEVSENIIFYICAECWKESNSLFFKFVFAKSPPIQVKISNFKIICQNDLKDIEKKIQWFSQNPYHDGQVVNFNENSLGNWLENALEKSEKSSSLYFSNTKYFVGEVDELCWKFSYEDPYMLKIPDNKTATYETPASIYIKSTLIEIEFL